MTLSHQYCTFYLDGLLFGIESQKIQEVIRSLELTSVPLAPPMVSGLMNLRGQIVAALDLRQRLQLPARAPDAVPMCVVARTTDGVVSLLVDDIGDVVEVEEKMFERSPETLPAGVRQLIRGVYKLERQLLHVMETEEVCRVAEPKRAAQAQA
jgi:purine-binding chemotaxis protein CheW